MRYEWNSMLETGNTLIDNQHRQLFATLNQLVDAYVSGKGLAELERSLDFLSGYVVKHFADEEKMMVATKYPDYGIHRMYHENFKATVQKLTREMFENGVTEDFVINVGNIIADWLDNHIRGDDFLLATYLQTMKPNQPTEENVKEEKTSAPSV